MTAIRAGDTDGNPETIADPVWNSYWVNPPIPDSEAGALIRLLMSEEYKSRR